MQKAIMIGFIASALAHGNAARAETLRSSYQFRGEATQADFFVAGGCSATMAFIFGAEEVVHIASGQPIASTGVSAFVYSWNWCIGEVTQGTNSADASYLDVDGLSSANITVPIQFLTFGCRFDDTTGGFQCGVFNRGVADLSVTIAGTGDVSRGASISEWSGGPTHTVTRAIGASRAATASGSAGLDGTDLLAEASTLAMLYEVNGGFARDHPLLSPFEPSAGPPLAPAMAMAARAARIEIYLRDGNVGLSTRGAVVSVDDRIVVQRNVATRLTGGTVVELAVDAAYAYEFNIVGDGKFALGVRHDGAAGDLEHRAYDAAEAKQGPHAERSFIFRVPG